MLVIDEIHNVLAGRNEKQQEFLNALRYSDKELITIRQLKELNFSNVRLQKLRE